MKLNVSDIQNELGAQQSFNLILPKTPDMEAISVNQPVEVVGCVVNNGNVLELIAHVVTGITVQCSRCLDEVQIPLEFDFTERYCQCDSTKADKDLEEDCIEFQGEFIDLSQAVRENVLISQPLRFLCKDDCPGLCPQCGNNLKEGQCNCRKEEVDPRLAILSQLKSGR